MAQVSKQSEVIKLVAGDAVKRGDLVGVELTGATKGRSDLIGQGVTPKAIGVVVSVNDVAAGEDVSVQLFNDIVMLRVTTACVLGDMIHYGSTRGTTEVNATYTEAEFIGIALDTAPANGYTRVAIPHKV